MSDSNKILKFTLPQETIYVDREELANLIWTTLAPSEILRLKGSGRHRSISAHPASVLKFEIKPERTGSTGD